MNDYAVFDIETTGLDPLQDSIIELGWMVVRGGQAEKVNAYLTNPGAVRVPPEIVGLTGITQEMVDQGEPLKDVLRQFIEETQDIPLVGHNAVRFDWPFIANALENHYSEGLTAFVGKDRIIDTAALFKGYKLGKKQQIPQRHADYARNILAERVYGLKYSLPVCCDELGVETSGLPSHRVAGDIVATDGVFQKLVETGWRPWLSD